jgi:hypothetical protein
MVAKISRVEVVLFMAVEVCPTPGCARRRESFYGLADTKYFISAGILPSPTSLWRSNFNRQCPPSFDKLFSDQFSASWRLLG